MADQRVSVNLTTKGAQFCSNSGDNGATTKVTADEARLLYAQGYVDTEVPRAIDVGAAPNVLPVGERRVVRGFGFGATQGTGTVTLGGVDQTVVSWSDTEIVIEVTKGALVEGGRKLQVTPDSADPTNLVACYFDEAAVDAGAFSMSGTAARFTPPASRGEFALSGRNAVLFYGIVGR